MQFVVKRDILLKSLNFVQGVVEKKNTLPILSNVLLELKDKKLSIVATDLDIIFYDEINDVKILLRKGWKDLEQVGIQSIKPNMRWQDQWDKSINSLNKLQYPETYFKYPLLTYASA